MGLCSGKASSVEAIRDLQEQVEQLQNQLNDQNAVLVETGAVTAEPIVLAEAVPVTPKTDDETVAGTSINVCDQDRFSGQRLPNVAGDFGWEIISGANILIGPGSYYHESEVITVCKEVTDQEDAWRWIQQLDSEAPNNPVVMWQMGCMDGRKFDNQAYAHRLQFMAQSLGANTGNSPRAFVCSTQGGDEELRGKVFLRTDDWWSSNRQKLGEERISPQLTGSIGFGWEVISGANILIGPGSYYHDSELITVCKEVTDQEDARRWIQQLDSEAPNNPVVMWQMGCMDGRKFDNQAYAHRLQFMAQNLGANTGNSPRAFVCSTQGGDEKLRGKVCVRTDDWWSSNRQKLGEERISPQLTGSVGFGWEVISGANILIGPGSYYHDSEVITVCKEVTDQEDARRWIQQLDSEAPNNPVVMWQIGCTDGRRFDNQAYAHRLQFMAQNLDADTGNSPRAFVCSTQQFLQHGDGKLKTKVCVRTDDWWKKQQVQLQLLSSIMGRKL